VDVGRDESAYLEGVLDDGQRSTGIGTVDFEDHTNTGHQSGASTFAGPDNLDGRGRYSPCTHANTSIWLTLVYSEAAAN
jgi:hypothetical protein